MQDAISFKDLFFHSATSFSAEHREFYATIESMPHGKDFGSHDSHTLPHYQFRGL
jgi:hypothetical protein